MDVVKFKITPKTIKIEVRNTNNYVFDFNKAVEMEKEIGCVVEALQCVGASFRGKHSECKSYISPNQTGIFDQM
jgi:hypothetical protein